MDSQWSWFISAYFKAKKLSKIHKFDAFMYWEEQVLPFWLHILISKNSGVPFVAECFDPIISTEWSRSRVAYKWNAWMEKVISLNAKAVIWYTQGALNEARSRHRRLEESRTFGSPRNDSSGFLQCVLRKRGKTKILLLRWIKQREVSFILS